MSRLAAPDGGWALVSVLWAMTMLSVMAAATEQLTIVEHRAERHAWERLRASAALDAVLTKTIVGLEAADPSKRWVADGSLRQQEFEDLAVKVALQDQAGCFDLNVVDGHTLTALLRGAGLSDDDAEFLAGSILNWRGPAELHVAKGAVDADYEAAHLKYRPRHGNFQSVEELQLVFGMRPELFEKLKPALTVYTRNALIDTSVAPKTALLGYYDGDQTAVDAALAQRNDAIGRSVILTRSGTAANLSQFQGRVYEVRLETVLGGRSYKRDVVFMLTGFNERPDLPVAWQGE